MLDLVNVSKYYSSEGNVALGLRNINLHLDVNEIVAVVGESGSGKTTLLNVISGIDSYEEGEMYFNNKETSYYSLADWEEYRKNNIGFIFQNYNLIDSFNVLQNVETVLLLQGKSHKEARKAALDIIEKVGLSHRKKTKAAKLSGGEKQRTVIARAIASDAKILVCDEPTGNLDSESGKKIMALINEVAANRLVVIVTHDYKIVEPYATRKIRLFDGEIVEDVKVKPTKEETALVEESKRVKSSYLTSLVLAIKNLFSTPHKSIFSYLIYLAVILFVVLIYQNLRLDAYSNTQPTYIYDFRTDRRIVINKKDGSLITESDLNKIKSLGNIEALYTNDFYLDSPLNFEINSRFTYGFYQSSDLLSSNDLIIGRLPENANEIVLGFTNPIDEDKANEYLNIEVNISYNNMKVKIVGVGNKSVGSRYYGAETTIYGTEGFANKLKATFFDDYFELEVESIPLDDFRYNYVIIAPNNEIEDNVVVLNYFLPNPSPYAVSDSDKLILKSFYGKNLIENVTYQVKYFESDTFNVVVNLNDNTINKILNQNIYQMTVMVKDNEHIDNTARQLENLGYFTIIPYKGSYNLGGSFMLLEMIFKVVMIIIAFITIYTISYLVLSLVINTKKKDYVIYRTLGASKNNVSLMLLYENVILGVIAYTSSIIIAYTVNKFVPNSAFKYLSNNGIQTLLIILLITILMIILISFRFRKKLFNATINSSLKKD
jgi:ABC-type lipoprotein export system ATPase subunit